MALLVAAPVILALLSAVIGILVHRHHRLQRVLSILGAAGQMAAACALLWGVCEHGYLVAEMGGWPAPFGIVLVADMFGAVMVAMTAATGLVVALYSVMSLPRDDRSPMFHPLVHFLLMGVGGAFLTGDLFNLYVCFEVLLIASFVLLSLERRADQMEGTVKYVILNLISSAFFLTAVGLLYAKIGTLNMADISQLMLERSAQGTAEPLLLEGYLMMVAFSIKAGLFPVFFWLPASYHTPTPAVSALFSGLLTKVGVYALVRLYTLIMPGGILGNDLLMALGVVTMITGVFGAASQMNIRRILTFHIISQIGYMVAGLAIATPLGLAACVFYICHNIIVKGNLVLVGGVAADAAGSEDLRRIGGLWIAWPLLGLVFLVPALSLAGIPPLSGFFAKLGIVVAGFEEGYWWMVAAALFTGAFTLYSMFKIWIEAFWKDHPELEAAQLPVTAPRFSRLLPMVVLALSTILVGVAGGPLFGFCERIGEQLFDPNGYIVAVLGARP